MQMAMSINVTTTPTSTPRTGVICTRTARDEAENSKYVIFRPSKKKGALCKGLSTLYKRPKFCINEKTFLGIFFCRLSTFGVQIVCGVLCEFLSGKTSWWWIRRRIVNEWAEVFTDEAEVFYVMNGHTRWKISRKIFRFCHVKLFSKQWSFAEYTKLVPS